jgi:copper(I)-binding protein
MSDMKTRLLTLFISTLLLLSILASCAPDAPAINIGNAWGRPSPGVDGSGVIYLLIKNTGNQPDKLLAARSSACGTAEIHETVTNADGIMGMNMPTNPVDVPANGQVEFKSGSFHIMCMMMKADQFKVGAQVDLFLKFEKSGEKKVSVGIHE